MKRLLFATAALCLASQADAAIFTTSFYLTITARDTGNEGMVLPDNVTIDVHFDDENATEFLLSGDEGRILENTISISQAPRSPSRIARTVMNLGGNTSYEFFTRVQFLRFTHLYDNNAPLRINFDIGNGEYRFFAGSFELPYEGYGLIDVRKPYDFSLLKPEEPVFSGTSFAQLGYGPFGFETRVDRITNRLGYYSSQFALPAPEPATWAMMIGGIGMVGSMMRRRRSVGVRLTYA